MWFSATNIGKVYYIKNIDATGDLITIDGNGSETIEGSLNYFLRGFKHSVRIISDGTSWHVLEEAASNGTYHCGEYKDLSWSPVTNPVTGKTWMDRNLGATKVAVTSTDADAYGDLYQWGRLADGHQCRNSGTTARSSTTDIPGNANFIINTQNWRNPGNDLLWDGVNGINNPCPSGYRLPTKAEWIAEYSTWVTQNIAGAFSSTLKLTATGFREKSNGNINLVGTRGHYWASGVVSATNSHAIRFDSSVDADGIKGDGFSVRCIKD